MAVDEQLPEENVNEWAMAFLLKHFLDGTAAGMTESEAAQYSLNQLGEYMKENINKRKALDAFMEGMKRAPFDR